MRFAAVDIGNSNVKMTLWNDQKKEWSSTVTTLNEAIENCALESITAVAYSSNVKIEPDDLRKIENAEWWNFKNASRLPLTIKYQTPETLGSDRLAAAIGACSRWPDKTVMIADAGTALTLDVVLNSGEFLGGNISPGYEMRLKALNHYTSFLPLVDLRKPETLIGDSTVTALSCGAYWGLVSEVAGVFSKARKIYGCEMLVMTGGSANSIIEDVRRSLDSTDTVVEDKYLVAEGLKKAYYYNHDK